MKQTFPASTPIVVDLDGTLIYSELSFLSLKRFFQGYPHLWWKFPFWLLKGRAHTKERLARIINISADDLDFNEKLVAELKTLKAKGHSLILATGANKLYADFVAQQLPLFDRIIASQSGHNTISHVKARILVESYGEGNLVYYGNSMQDIAVWRVSAYAVAVNAKPKVIRALKDLKTPWEIFS